MAPQTYKLTRRELHLEVSKWQGYINECPTFWNEPTILDKTLPVLMSAVLDVQLYFLEAMAYNEGGASP